MTPTEIDDLDKLGENLDFVEAQLSADATKANVRHTSAVLRQMLVENTLHDGWKALKLEPRHPVIFAYKLQEQFIDKQTTSWAGGARSGSSSITQIRFVNRAFSEDEIKARAAAAPTLYPFPLHEFLDSAAASIEGMRIKRRQLILYIANKTGGVHLDHSRDQKKDREAYLALDRLDASSARTGDNGLLPTVHELLAIGQALVSSQDVVRLRRSIAAVVQ